MMGRNLNNIAVVQAGLIAGAVFMFLEMLLVATIGGGSPWAPPRMIAAIVLGKEVLPPPATFDMMIFAVAMVVHFALSVIFAYIFAVISMKWALTMGRAMTSGIAFGLLLYFGNFYVMTAMFPWFAMARNGISLFAHAAFGLVLGWSYFALMADKRIVR